MDYTLEDKVVSKTKAQEILKKLKSKERKITLYSKRINKNTIVCCKNKERFVDFENSLNNVKVN